MKPILCFGEALIDFHPRGTDARGFASDFVPYAGGAQANVAVAIAKLGGQSRFAGMLSTDRFGDFLLDALQQAGVDTRHVVRTSDAPTALAFVQLDAHGERSFTFYRPPSADMLFRPEHFQDASFVESGLLHVCSLSMSELGPADATCEAMRRARANGALVSFDMNLRPARWANVADPRPVIWRGLELADVVKLSREEFEFIAVDGDAALLQRLWQGHARLLLVTDGAGTMRWFAREARGELPAFKVRTLDSTGAGDAFVAGLLSQLAGQGIEAAQLDALIADTPRLLGVLRYAAACGALTATRVGSFAAMPSISEIAAFLEEHP